MAVKIGVISDTHLNGYDQELREIIDTHFKNIELILHAGDITDLSVLDMFAGREVRAVCGNMDDALWGVLPSQLEFTIDGFRFGLIHGWGNPQGLRKTLRDRFEDLDCLVYGHTHQAFNECEDGVLYFNPGSTSSGRFSSRRSIGIIETGSSLSGEIISL